MGKKGDALRAAKAKTTVYSFTREQLDDRDRALLVTYRARVKKETDEYIASERRRIWKMVEEDWDERTRILCEGEEDGTHGLFTAISLLESVCARILVEHFGWAPVGGKRRSDRFRLNRFCNLLVDEINGIMSTETGDIRRYNEEVYELYGVKFITEDGKKDE